MDSFHFMQIQCGIRLCSAQNYRQLEEYDWTDRIIATQIDPTYEYGFQHGLEPDPKLRPIISE